MSASVAASDAGLSQRIRLMRGKRSATPDLCRVNSCAEIEGNLEHQLLAHLAHRPERLHGIVAHPFVELLQLLVGETKIGLADWHDLIALPHTKCVVRIE